MPKYNRLFVYIFSASQLNLWNSKFKATASLRQKRILWKKTNLPTRESIQGLKRQTRFSLILILPIQWQKRWLARDELYIFFFVCVWTLFSVKLCDDSDICTKYLKEILRYVKKKKLRSNLKVLELINVFLSTVSADVGISNFFLYFEGDVYIKHTHTHTKQHQQVYCNYFYSGDYELLIWSFFSSKQIHTFPKDICVNMNTTDLFGICSLSLLSALITYASQAFITVTNSKRLQNCSWYELNIIVENSISSQMSSKILLDQTKNDQHFDNVSNVCVEVRWGKNPILELI